MSLPNESVLVSGHPDFVRTSDIPRRERERAQQEAGDAIAADAVADYRRAVKRIACLPAIIDIGPKGDEVAAEVIDMSRMAYVRHGDECIAESPDERREQVALHVAEICLHVRTFYPLSAERHFPRERRNIQRLAATPDGSLTQLGVEWAERYATRFMEAHDLGLVACLEASNE